MTSAIIHDGMTFTCEDVFIAFCDAEDENSRTPGAIRQKRYRDRERRADTYWDFRIQNNRVLPEMIANVSDEMIGQAKNRAMVRLQAHIELFPERVTE